MTTDPARIGAICDALQQAWVERPGLTFAHLLYAVAPMDWKTTDDEILARLMGAYPPNSPEAKVYALRELCDEAEAGLPAPISGKVYTNEIRAILGEPA